MTTRLRLTACLALLATAAGVRAEPLESLDAFVGTWQRVRTDGGADAEPSHYRFLPVGSGLQGLMLEPPEGLSCDLTLNPEGEQIVGWATWVDEAISSRIKTRWELTPKGDDVLEGRCEWVDWSLDDGSVIDRGWYAYRFERVPRVGLVTQGEAEEPFGQPVEHLGLLEGGWEGPGGAWVLTAPGPADAVLRPLGPDGEPDDARKLVLRDERGTLRGEALLEGGGSAPVELAWDEGRLLGRSQWREQGLGEQGDTGWAPLEFRPLRRLDAAAERTRSAQAPAPGAEGTLAGVYKRDDGLFLRVRDEGGALTGDLVDAEGAVRARLRFESQDGLWVGEANWEGVTARWELALGPEGLEGRCQWVDLQDGRPVARGWTARSFRRLERLM